MAGQEDIIRFLGNPATHGGVKVDRIETHISHIFLAGMDVYKLKKAIRLPFLDFSTAEKRHQACRNEVRINRRTAPDIYFGVLKIAQSGIGLTLGGDGAPLDWVVHMARFPADALLSDLAEHQRLTPALIDALADTIADFHNSLGRQGMQGNKLAFCNQIEQLSTFFSAADFQGWRKTIASHFTAGKTRMATRRRHGFVRHCHGDLHLANICLWQGRPTPFDAIEFNDDLATIDTLFDLAFPVMDLYRYGYPHFANQLLSRYLEAMRDYSGLGLFPLFLSIRAAVRAMVHMMNKSEDQTIQQYFSTARALLERSDPKLIAIGGLSGSGKSTLARQLAPDIGGGIGAIHIRSDGIRKRLYGVRPETKLPEDAYVKKVSATTYRQLRRDVFRALKSGATVIADATFLRPEDKNHMAITAKNVGVPFLGLWLEAPQDDLQARIEKRTKDASDATIAVLEHQIARGYGANGWQIIPTGNGLESTCVRTIQAINRKPPHPARSPQGSG